MAAPAPLHLTSPAPGDGADTAAPPRSDPADFDTVPPLDSGPGPVERILRAVIVLAMLALVVLAATDRLGMRSESASKEGGGLRLKVEYPAVTRPGLPSPVRFEITSADGRDLPSELVVRVDTQYLTIFDAVQPSPQPSQSTSTSDVTEWTFDVAPGSRSMAVDLDATLQPSTHRGRTGRVAVLADGAEAVALKFTTTVVP